MLSATGYTSRNHNDDTHTHTHTHTHIIIMQNIHTLEHTVIILQAFVKIRGASISAKQESTQSAAEMFHVVH